MDHQMVLQVPRPWPPESHQKVLYEYQDHVPSEALIETIDQQRVIRIKTMGHQRPLLRSGIIRGSYTYRDHGPSEALIETMDHQRHFLRPWIIRGTYSDHGSSEALIETMDHQRHLLRPWIIRGSYEYQDHRSSETLIETIIIRGSYTHQDHGPSETLIETMDHQRVLRVSRPWAIRDSY